MPAEGVILELGTQADTDRLQDRSTGGSGGGSVLGVHSGRNVYRPFFSPGAVVRRELVGGLGGGPGIKRASDPVPHCAHGEGAAGNRSLDVPGFSPPFAHRDPFPPLDVDAARNQRSLEGSKAGSCFARYPDRRSPGLISADDGSQDVDQIWLHGGRRMSFSRQQLLQCITEHAFGNSGRRRYLLRSEHEGHTWVSVADSILSSSRPPSEITPWEAQG